MPKQVPTEPLNHVLLGNFHAMPYGCWVTEAERVQDDLLAAPEQCEGCVEKGPVLTIDTNPSQIGVAASRQSAAFYPFSSNIADFSRTTVTTDHRKEYISGRAQD